MKKLMLVLLGLGFALMPDSLVAQNGQGQQRGMNGWGRNSRYCQLYNRGEAVELKGEVIEINKFTPENGWGYGLELVLKTPAGQRTVHLGPGWYLEKQELQLQVGDKVKVEGAQVEFDGREVVMAAEVERGEMSLKLRDDSGRPQWR